MARKNRVKTDTVGISTETFIRNEQPTEGIVNGRCSDKIAEAFHRVGIALFNNTKVISAVDWGKLPESLRNYYRSRYPKKFKTT